MALSALSTRFAILATSFSDQRLRKGCLVSTNCNFERVNSLESSFVSADLLKKMGSRNSNRREGVQQPWVQICASVGTTEEPDVTKKTEVYSSTMQQAMGGALTYRHELGMNYAHVLPDLIVGSCLQTPADVGRLKKAGVCTIFCLQEDSDLAYFSVDISAIQARALEADGIEHIRARIRDFDPYDLRIRLPSVVANLHNAVKRNGGTTYIHCTAGLGRAPAVALAYMYWLRGYELNQANQILQSVRHCHPKLDSIKAATCDLLTDRATEDVTLSWERGASESVEISGLDVGWGQRIPFTGKNGTWYLERELPVGRYEYKYVVDGTWTVNPDDPTTQPNKDGHVNNYVEIRGDRQSWNLRQRIMAEDSVLTEDDRKLIRLKLESLVEH